MEQEEDQSSITYEDVLWVDENDVVRKGWVCSYPVDDKVNIQGDSGWVYEGIELDKIVLTLE